MCTPKDTAANEEDRWLEGDEEKGMWVLCQASHILEYMFQIFKDGYGRFRE
jgi:hypothetical protein